MAEKKTWRSMAVAITAVGALGLSACGGGNGGGDDGGGVSSVSVYNSEPQFLMPGNATEVGGSKVLEQLYTPLTSVDYDNYEAGPGVAESWESDDQITWTFELSEDWTFHNGEEITAQTFVDTFNWTVDPDNAQQNATFYEVFLGYEDVVEGDAEELEGVRAVDDYTLEFELNEPFSPLPLMLSYTGFYPLPSEAFEDPESFEQAPIGNGQYQMDGEWEHDVRIDIERFEDWPLESTGGPDRIEWMIYSDVDVAYTDVQAGNLDLLHEIPPNRITEYDADFGEELSATFETGSYEYIGMPLYQDEFDDPDLRHALSMAIDRDEIIDNIFGGERLAATNVIPPMIDVGSEGACEYCEFDPEAAAELYEEAGGPSELTYYFNSGAGHDDYIEAIANQWQQHLPIDSVEFESLEFAQYLDLQLERELDGPYRLGWAMSYPSPQYALEPIYTTGASSNYFDYSSEEFDQLIADANSADTPEEADELYVEAEAVLVEDMPGIPLWFRGATAVHSDRIDNDSVSVDLRSFPRVEELVINE